MKKLKNNINTYLDHITEREKIMLIAMIFVVIGFIVYLFYYFLLYKKMIKLEKKNSQYYEAILKIKDIGPEFIKNNSLKDNSIKIPKKEVQLYSILGAKAEKNSIEIKSINEKPVNQEFNNIITKEVEIVLNAVSLNKASKLLADIENINEAPVYIKDLNISREYSDDTKVNMKFSVRTYYEKPATKE